jgi:hypothetical protein
MDQNLMQIRPTTWLKFSSWPPKEANKADDVQWLLWCVFHLLKTYSNLKQCHKGHYEAYNDDAFDRNCSNLL